MNENKESSMATQFLTGDRVSIYDTELNLAGDKGVITDIGERVRVKLDRGGEVEVSARQCRRLVKNWVAGTRAA